MKIAWLIEKEILNIIKNASQELIENNTITNLSSSGTIQSEEGEVNKEKLHVIELIINYPLIYKS